MHAEDVERVVIAELELQPGAGPEADRPGDDSDQEPLHRQNKSRCRRDRSKSGDRAGDHSEHGRFAARPPFERHPGERAGARGEMRGHDRHRGARVCAQCRAAVESEPADPQETGADHRQSEIVRRQIVAAIATPRTEHVSCSQSGDAGVQVHHRAAGEIDHASGTEETAAPHPVRDRYIDQQKPEHTEQQKCREAQTIGNRTRDKRHSDNGECHLVDHEKAFGNGLCQG